MQSCVTASRDTLGESWLQAYLAAPIWRFWLGAEICGATVVGALMPSLDGIGRYYPLTLFACADAGEELAPPDVDAHEHWFGAVELFLLATLDGKLGFDAIAEALDELPMPNHRTAEAAAAAISTLDDGTLAGPAPQQSFADFFAQRLSFDHARLYASASFWWTVGGEGYQPAGFCCHRMPAPFLFANMLTGRMKQTVT